MTAYEAVIGLEVHAELLTASKMFCGCSADYSAAPAPNTFICPVCTALPGALPVANQNAIEKSVLVGLALNCTVNERSIMARKNYFYPDLPKGYQISQYELPIAEHGWLEVEVAGSVERIRVRRAHIEEDTAKSFHQTGHTLIDYNRAGVPLLEIVSEPDLRSADAAVAYATGIRSILRYLNVNSGDMEKGVLRFEANVSVRPAGSDQLRTRTEIKNLNSFRALARAVEFEIARQSGVYESGGQVEQETLGWDDLRGVTVSQRSKEHAHDYRYFPEPDLPAVIFDARQVTDIRKGMPELPAAKLERFIREFGLKAAEAGLFVADRPLADYFEATVAQSRSAPKVVYNWMAGEFMRYLAESGHEVDRIPVTPVQFAELVDMVTDKKISANSGKAVLAEMFLTGKPADSIVREQGLGLLSDEAQIREIVAKVLADNPKEVADYLAGKDTVFQWLMGQVARATQGKADPQVARALLEKSLNELKKA